MPADCRGRSRLARLAQLVFLAILWAMVSANWVVVWACEGQTGRGPFVITGEVTDETGRPVGGLRLAWLPALPGATQPDLGNLYYSIQGPTGNEAITDEDGRFSMTEVLDYFAVASHQYFVWGQDTISDPPRNPYWRVTGGEVSLARTPPTTVSVRLIARPAGAVRLRVTTADGRPFEGALPVHFRPAEAAGEQAEGAELLLTCQFRNGEYLQGGLQPGRTRVAILNGSSAEAIRFRNYLLTRTQGEGTPVTLAVAKDTLLRTELAVIAGETRGVDFTLPR